MPHALSFRITALLVALAFGLALALQVLLGGGASAAKTSGEHRTSGPAPTTAGLRLAATGTVPALREPKQLPARTPKPLVRAVARAAPTDTPVPIDPAASPTPTPSAAPRYIPPAPAPVAPRPTAPKPKPTPAPTPPPPSGEFDTTGEP
jgi:hypothetical protein